MAWTDPRGYVRLLLNGREVYEHRVVAERMLGRPLRRYEQVHHRNGQKNDNRPANLEVLDGRTHVTTHWRHGSFAARVQRQTKPDATCPRCGHFGKPWARSMCKRCYLRDYYERHPEKWKRE